MSFADDIADTSDLPPVDDSLALLAAHRRLGPRARRVLLSIAQRMARAAVAYGDDFERPADWRREAQEERLDLLVYETVALEDSRMRSS